MTSNISTQPYRGARDFYPEDMRLENYVFDTWKRVCKSYGFEQYYFPVLEPLELFAAKSGQELVSEQLFSFEDRGGRKLAIRPELTPSTVRMIAGKYGELPRPIKWFMIGDNWRYERPQKGRGREFYQLEVNTFGEQSVLADFEIFALAIDIMKAFGATEKMFEMRFSDRRLITALLNDLLELPAEKQVKIRRIMDKRIKVGKEAFFEMLAEEGLTIEQCQSIEDFMSASFENMENVLGKDIVTNNEGYRNLVELASLLNSADLIKFCKFDPSIIRGFDYSDGLVYEVFDKNPENARSIYGGERFDRLVQIFGEYDLPATGFAMGDYTLREFLEGWNLLPKLEDSVEYFVTVWPAEDSRYFERSLEIANKLREDGKRVLVWINKNTKLDKQLKYANKKGASYAVIIGEEEIKNNKATFKDLKSGKQEELSL
jgi:histidyl-tRNA synthetase